MQFLRRHADGLEHGGYRVLVVLRAILDEFNGGFEVIEEAVDIGNENRDIAAGSEELGDFDGGDCRAVSMVKSSTVIINRDATHQSIRSVACQLDLSLSHISIYRSICSLEGHTPVDPRVAPLGEDTLNQLGVEDLLEVLLDQRESLAGVHASHVVFRGESQTGSDSEM